MSREFRFSERRNFEDRENIGTNNKEWTSPGKSTKMIVKKSIRITETVTVTTKHQRLTSYECDKENRNGQKETVVTGKVKQLKSHYEEYFSSQKNTLVVENQNTKEKAAIKKQEKPNDREKSTEAKEEGPKPRKRPKIGDDDPYPKSRFAIYNDVSKSSDAIKTKEAKKAKETLKNDATYAVDVNNRCPDFSDKALDKIVLPRIGNTSSSRVTPVEVANFPPKVPKKVKVVRRKNLMSECQKADQTAICGSHSFEYELPYDDCFLRCELEKEASAPRIHRRRNITSKQRTIIVKFLTRLNTHLFLPSFFLYQTVKLFDAVLDTKNIEIEDLQLHALAAMWIALKREQTVYKVPSATKMMSFAVDLYEGKTSLLMKCEMDILQTLNFNIVFSDPFSILCYNISKFRFTGSLSSYDLEVAYACGSYMIDVSLFDEDLMKISAVLLAAAAAETALYFTVEKMEECHYEPDWYLWRTDEMSRRFSNADIDIVRSMLIRRVDQSSTRHSDAELVFKKYQRSRYGRISNFFGNKVSNYLTMLDSSET